MVNKPRVPPLIPGEGCFVAHEHESGLGIVVNSKIEQQTPYVEVRWESQRADELASRRGAAQRVSYRPYSPGPPCF